MASHGEYPQPHELDRLQDLMEWVGEADDRMDKLLTVASLDAETYSSLLDIYQRKAAQVVTKDVFYPYPAISGEFLLGTDPDGRGIGLTREQLNEHLLLVGMTGSGKTTFFYNLMDTCAEKAVPFMVFRLHRPLRGILRPYLLPRGRYARDPQRNRDHQLAAECPP